MSGDYPEVMKKNVGSRLPSFTKIQSGLIKNSFDFIGINHYFSVYVNDRPIERGARDFNGDMSVYYRGEHKFCSSDGDESNCYLTASNFVTYY